MTSKAARIRAKRAQAALQAVCAVTGVVISGAEPRGKSKRLRAVEPSDPDVMRPALSRMCRIMGWPDDEQHRKRARDQKLITLHGRLTVAGRLDPDHVAYEGIERADRLDRAFRRIILGANVPLDGEWAAEYLTEAERAERRETLKRCHAELTDFIGAMPRHQVSALVWCKEAPDDLGPHHVPNAFAAAIRDAGLALARHLDGLARA